MFEMTEQELIDYGKKKRVFNEFSDIFLKNTYRIVRI